MADGDRLSARPARPLALGLVTLALAGCGSVGLREPASIPSPLPDANGVTATPLPEHPTAVAATEEADDDAFARFQSRLGRFDCGDDALIRQWQRTYAPAWPHFANAMDRSLPALLYVSDLLEEKHLPSEFALLPVVESWYQALPGRGDNPAGFWQFTRPTARDYNLVIDARQDQRLDLVPSSHAAVDHLAVLAEEFDHDWKLVDFAYNAGHFVVIGAQKRTTPERVAAAMPKTTREHWAKLCALTAILRNPNSHGYRPQTPAAAARLVEWQAPLELDWSFLAGLLDLAPAKLQEFNGGAVRGSIAAGARLALPAAGARRVDSALAGLPPGWGSGWSRTSVSADDTWSTLAHGDAGIAARLAQVNGMPIDAALTPGQPVWLHSEAPPPAAAAAPAATDKSANSGLHIVRSGESLWTIARKYGVTIEQLKTWNRLGKTALSIGQNLRISAPDTAGPIGK